MSHEGRSKPRRNIPVCEQSVYVFSALSVPDDETCVNAIHWNWLNRIAYNVTNHLYYKFVCDSVCLFPRVSVNFCLRRNSPKERILRIWMFDVDCMTQNKSTLSCTYNC